MEFDFKNLGGGAQTELIGIGAEAIGGTIGGIVDIAAGFGAKKRANEAIGTATQELNNLKASQPSLSTPSEYYDAVKNAYDQRLLSMRNQDINRSLATTTQAAQQYGSRGLGAVMQAQQQAQTQLGQEAMNQQQLQTQALTNLATARERETGLREQRSTRDLEYGYDAKALAEGQMAQARQQIAGGFTGAIGGVATAAGFGMLAGSSKPKTPKPPGEPTDSGDFTPGYNYGRRGLEVQRTPGEFNHDTNEMYVVDEDGRDVGIALTGGEYVIAPKDAQKLKQLAGSGKGKLHKFVGSLVRRFEKT
tara:strand:+ start:2724 stop:3638 length:915 start_codon:yes stop_codon:yes gene_type:complete